MPRSRHMDTQTHFGCASDDSLTPALCGDVRCFELGHNKVNQNLLLFVSVSDAVVFSVPFAAKSSSASG